MEVETDKAVQEIESIAKGTLTAKLVAPKEMVAVGQPIAAIELKR